VRRTAPRPKSSKRTKDCVRQALAAEFKAYLIADDGGRPKLILAGDQRIK
jgi:hypothetical protein